ALRRRGATHDAAMRRLSPDVDELASMRVRPIDSVAGDVRYALRGLRRNPGFTAVVMLTLALGIGGTTATFRVVDAVMLRPYPYPEIDRIVTLLETTRAGQQMSIAWQNFQDWRAQNEVFESLGLYRGMVINLTGGDRPERLVAAMASADLFEAGGVRPLSGRPFVADGDKPGAPPLAVPREPPVRAGLRGGARGGGGEAEP